MACRYYDDILIEKLKHWVPEASNLRVLKPEESERLFKLTADDNADANFKMPFMALSRDTDIELSQNIKTNKSFDGLKLLQNSEQTIELNVIPIKLSYQLDIYTKKQEEADEYVREFLFKLINNPLIKIEIPYNDTKILHTANIRVLSTVSDTSDIGERVFSGQFTRWTIQLEIQDAFLFSIPYRKNWKFIIEDTTIEVSKNIKDSGEVERII